MNIPKQTDPPKVSSTALASKQSRARARTISAVALLGCLQLSWAQTTDPLAILGQFASGGVRHQLEERIRKGSFGGPRISQGPEHLYRKLLELKVVRKSYTEALEKYLVSVQEKRDIFEREEAYIRVALAVRGLQSELQRFLWTTEALGLQLDVRDERLRQSLESYIDAKRGNLEQVLGPTRLLGMSESELVASLNRARETGKLLDAGMTALLAEIRRQAPNADFEVKSAAAR